MTSDTVRTLVIGASYGLLPAAKIAASGHPVTVVGRSDEIAAIGTDGVGIDFGGERTLRPPMGGQGLRLSVPEAVDVSEHDLVFLAVQEPQAGAAALADLLARIGDRLPVAALMNMPPPPFLDRLTTLPITIRAGAYHAASVWAALSPDRMTQASPDAQAVRPSAGRPGLLQVTLPSNFKFAPFARPADQALLDRVTRAASRVRDAQGILPVQFVTRVSPFTPLAKWPMLATGNCRCVMPQGATPRSIAAAVGGDPAVSRQIYDAVLAALMACGAPRPALVPFDNYAVAARRLAFPSSLARALHVGATQVERIDLLVLALLRETGQDAETCDLMNAVSATIGDQLSTGRRA